MPTYYFKATFNGGETPIFAAEFESLEAANKFTKRIHDQLVKECPSRKTHFYKLKNTRCRRIPRRVRTFSKPRRMTAHSIRKMPGVPDRWKIIGTQKRERRVLARA